MAFNSIIEEDTEPEITYQETKNLRGLVVTISAHITDGETELWDYC